MTNIFTQLITKPDQAYHKGFTYLFRWNKSILRVGEHCSSSLQIRKTTKHQSGQKNTTDLQIVSLFFFFCY
jgi:hypothetical protein